jgi:hypothetical protein
MSTKTTFHATDDQFVFQRTQEITDIVEQNKALYNATDERERWGEWTRYAQLPFVVIDDLNAKGIMRGFAVIDEKRFKAWMNDPENRHFRTRPGKV